MTNQLDASLSPEEVQQINRKMQQQQEEMAALFLRLQSHAIELSAFRYPQLTAGISEHHMIDLE